YSHHDVHSTAHSLLISLIFSNNRYFISIKHIVTPENYALSLHDALPISQVRRRDRARRLPGGHPQPEGQRHGVEALAAGRGLRQDRKSTRLNSSHLGISYAVFCLKKKKYIHEL